MVHPVGKAAPADLAAMDKLASGKGVPEGTGIATKYRAESAMGRGNIDEIVEAMGYKGSSDGGLGHVPTQCWPSASTTRSSLLVSRQSALLLQHSKPSEGPMTAFGQEVKTFFPGAEPGADADTGRLEGEELIDAYNMMRSREASSKEPVSKRVGAFLGQYGDLGALTK